jgi:ribosomal protein L37E
MATSGRDPARTDGATPLTAGLPHPCSGRRAAFLTQHGKERVVAAVLRRTLGLEVVRVEGYDTDRLGTFTREIPRAGTQHEAARTKARLGMDLSGESIGLGSEGAFGPDPLFGSIAWNVELLLWADAGLGIEIVAQVANGETNYRQAYVDSWGEVQAFAQATGFPSHGLVVAHGPEGRIVAKGLTDEASLARAFALAVRDSGRAWIETDMRGHLNPTRMRNIERAAEALARKLASLCPACGTPGFDAAERVRGLPCADCGYPTREARAEVWRCVRCPHQEVRDTAPAFADPARCQVCNP